MEIEEIFKIDFAKAKAIAFLEIERYKLDIKGKETSIDEEAALLFGIIAGMAYSEIEHKVCYEQESKYSEDYVDFLERIVRMKTVNPEKSKLSYN